jgi:hypothetical protein
MFFFLIMFIVWSDIRVYNKMEKKWKKNTLK